MSGLQLSSRWRSRAGAWLLGALSLGPIACKGTPEQQRPGGTLRSQDLEGVRLLGGRTVAQGRGIEPELLAELERSTDRVRALIRFERPLTLVEHHELHERGVRFLEHLRSRTYVVSLPRGTDLGQAPFAGSVRWAGRIFPEDKLDPRLSESSGEGARELGLRVIFFADVPIEQAERELQRLRHPGRKVAVGPIFEIGPANVGLQAILASALVTCIEPTPRPPRRSNSSARTTANTDLVQKIQPGTLPPVYDGVIGRGIKIGICDYGVDHTHQDLADSTGVSRVDPTHSTGDDWHGTISASVAAGGGWASPGFELRGQAPGAEIASYQTLGGNASAYDKPLGVDEVHVTNHSETQGSFPGYDSVQRSIDTIVRGGSIDGLDLPSRPAVWAAGNLGVSNPDQPDTGYYSVYSTAKNTICVGSVDTSDGLVSEFSSLGPTLDGRIKPDLVAPGARRVREELGVEEGIRCASWTVPAGYNYAFAWGTSVSAPVVTGIIALMMESMEAVGVDLTQVLPSTYKAILAQTALDLVRASAPADFADNPDTETELFYHAGPDFASGFGLVDAHAAVQMAGDTRLWDEGTLNAEGQFHTYTFVVPVGVARLRFTLAWDDAPAGHLGAPSDPKLVNDLDLWLVDPTGSTLRPWRLLPIPGSIDDIDPTDVVPAAPGVDSLNNVEMVDVATPVPGTWQLKVGATRLMPGASQSYSLAGSLTLEWSWTPVVKDRTSLVFEVPRLEDPDILCAKYVWFCDWWREWLRTRLLRLPVVVPIDWRPDTILVLPEPELVSRTPQAWTDPPDLLLELEGLPEESVVLAFDDFARLLVEQSDGGPHRRIEIPIRSVGQRTYVALAQPSGRPLSIPTTVYVQARIATPKR